MRGVINSLNFLLLWYHLKIQGLEGTDLKIGLLQKEVLIAILGRVMDERIEKKELNLVVQEVIM